MRKSEYLHLHALVFELRLYLQETETVPPEAFAAYDAYGVAPTGVHRRKDHHHEALNRLRDGVLSMINATDRPTTEPTASTQTVKETSPATERH